MLFGVQKLTAQANYLSGHIKGEEFIDGSKVSILIFSENSAKLGWLSLREPDSIINVPLRKDGTFELDFTPNSPLFYFRLIIFRGDSEIKELRRDFSHTPYLGESGDSIHVEINIGRDRVQFSGLGAEKLNCQYLLNRFKESSESRGPYYFMGPFNKVQPFTSFERIYLSNLAYRLTIIDQYDGIIEQSVINLIKSNVVAASKFSFASYLVTNSAFLSKDVTYALREYFEGNNKISKLLAEDMTLSDAPIYSDFILKKCALQYKIENSIIKPNPLDEDGQERYVDWMYNQIKNNYSGSLRDRLITNWLLDSGKDHHKYQAKVMDDALSVIQEEKYIQVLNKFRHLSIENNKIYNFEFIDEDDKIHTSKNYLDKILIIDFWYTGCINCTDIPPVLRIIKEEFKHRGDIVFLSVNVESSKKGWISGLQSGLYTIPGQIHLKTPGIGRTDPFIMNYHIRSYPYLMVVGKNNMMLSVSPQDPRDDQGRDIINIVRRAIQ